MAKIRRANFFDKFELKKMVSFLGSDAVSLYTKAFMNFPFNFLHEVLPLKLKFLSETFVLEEKKELSGMITVSTVKGNHSKIFINRLFLSHDYFNTGKQLIDFIMAKFGAKGANAFLCLIDDSYSELLHLFSEGCGFRQCSSEQLWKLADIKLVKENNSFFRIFKNSDAQAVSMLFNEAVITHFKYSVSKIANEYKESVFRGLTSDIEFQYIVEDEALKTILAHLSVSTSDNQNYILEITDTPWHECPYEDILNFAVKEISKRNKKFSLFIKLKKYMTTAENLEKFLQEKGAVCVQNQILMVKDFYKVIQNAELNQKIVLFNEIKEKPVFKS